MLAQPTLDEFGFARGGNYPQKGLEEISYLFSTEVHEADFWGLHPGPARYQPAATGCQSSTRFPSGSVNQPNFPKS